MSRYVFDVENLYNFRYKAKGEGILHIYDKSPLAFIIDVQPTSLLGINIHWLPKALRDEFIWQVQEIINQTPAKHQRRERIRLTYGLLKKPKYRYALQGIRRYLISNITNIQKIPEAKWEIVLGIRRHRARFAYKSKNYKIN